MIFENRKEAGKILGTKLLEQSISHPIILALTRGGVPVGAEVAKMLTCPLEVLLVRKIGAPHNPEYGIGAVAEGGVMIWHTDTISRLALTTEQLQKLKKMKEDELSRQMFLYREGKSLPSLKGQTAIIVDDGLATGITALAAIQAVKKEKPKKIILAVPVGAPETLEQLQSEVNEIICIYTPDYLEAIGAFYQNFTQVSDEEVMQLLGVLS